MGAGTLALALGACAGDKDIAGMPASRAVAPSKTALLTEKGDARRASGDLKGAARYYLRASMLSPDNQDLLVKLGQATHATGKFGRAETVFRRALVLDSQNPEALRGLGNALVAQDRAKDAINYYRAAVAAGSSTGKHNPRAYIGLGVALDMTGDHKAAQQTYRVGLKRSPGQAGLKNNLGPSLAMDGKYAQAIAVLKELADGANATDRHRQNLALVYGLAGDSSKAESVARNDLNVREVKANLAYYRWLRAAKAGNKRPETAKTGRATAMEKPKKADKPNPRVKRQMAAKGAKDPLARPRKDDLGPDIYSLGVDMGRGTTKKARARKRGAGALPGSVVATLKSMKRSGNYWVQLGSFKTRTLGDGAWRRVKSKQKKLLTAASHEIVKANLGAKGIYYRLQVGPYKNRAGAMSTCKGLKAAGVGCFIARRGKPSRTFTSRPARSAMKRAAARKKAAARMARRSRGKGAAVKTITIDKTGRKAVMIDKTRRKTRKVEKTRRKTRKVEKAGSKGTLTLRDKSGKVKAVIIDNTAKKTK